MPRRKKTEPENKEFIEDKKINEPTHKLLPEHTEEEAIPETDTLENKEEKPAEQTTSSDPPKAKPAEDKTVAEEQRFIDIEEEENKKIEPAKVEESPVVNKSSETKNENIVSSVEVEPAVAQPVTTPADSNIGGTPPPPISVPISQVDTAMAPDKNKESKLLFVGVGILFLLFLVGGTWFYFYNKSKKAEAKPKTIIFQPTGVNVSPTASANPKVASSEVKLSKYPVKVLNGSGVAGEASKVKAILEDEGFEVSETGNADDFEYKETVIQSKKSVEKSFVEKLRTILGKTYSMGRDEQVDSAENSEVVVIVGSGKAE